jgi:hypothetical protein
VAIEGGALLAAGVSILINAGVGEIIKQHVTHDKLRDLLSAAMGDTAGQAVRDLLARRDAGGQPVNHDVQRALRKAYLQATLVLCGNYLQELGVEPRLLFREHTDLVRPSQEVRWCDVVRRSIGKELRRLAAPGSGVEPRTTGADEHVVRLVDQSRTDAGLIEALGETLKEGLLQELREAHQQEPPAGFVKLLRDGWDEPAPSSEKASLFARFLRRARPGQPDEGDARRLDWLTLFRAFLVHEYKHNQAIAGVLLNQYLGQVQQALLERLDGLQDQIKNTDDRCVAEIRAALQGGLDPLIRQVDAELGRHLELLREDLSRQLQDHGQDLAAVRKQVAGALPLLALLPDMEARQQALADLVREEAERTRAHVTTEEEETRRVLEARFAALQVAIPEHTRLLVQEEVDRLREQWRREAERAQETARDPIPIPLPALRGTFVDRETERDTLRHLLREGDMRLAVIVAPGGFGKTELATKVLQEAAPGGRIAVPDLGGILYLRCAGGDLRLGRVFAAAGRIAGQRQAFEQTYGSRDLTLERKLEFFFQELSRAGSVWIILDNFEDLLAEDDTVADPELRQLLETAAGTTHGVRLLATTRAVPRFSGSHRLKPVDLQSGLPEEEAVAYLRAEGAECGLAETDEALLRAFVRRVHGIPKALESVVGYLAERYPVVHLAGLLADGELFADFDRYDAENGLKRLVAEQFADQAPDAQLALCALSVFAKPAPVAALRFLLPGLGWAIVLPRLSPRPTLPAPFFSASSAWKKAGRRRRWSPSPVVSPSAESCWRRRRDFTSRSTHSASRTSAAGSRRPPSPRTGRRWRRVPHEAWCRKHFGPCGCWSGRRSRWQGWPRRWRCWKLRWRRNPGIETSCGVPAQRVEGSSSILQHTVFGWRFACSLRPCRCDRLACQEERQYVHHHRRNPGT